MIKKLIAASVAVAALMVSSGMSTAKADVYRRPAVYRPYRPNVWVRPARPYVYTYPTCATYPAPAVYGYAPYYNTGVYVGVPGVSLRLGR